jgi:5-formyltetrahydrofolate cyclo-ligase
MEKSALRKSLLERRETMTKNKIKLDSEIIADELISYIQEHSVKTIHIYYPLEQEISTIEVIEFCLKNKVKVVTSKVLKDKTLKHLEIKSLKKMNSGIFGTMYPSPEVEYTGKYDLIVIPAIGFDHNKNRLGFGAGYYDTFLVNHKKTTKIGIAFNYQLIQEIPVEPHDISMDIIITPDKNIN